MRGLDHDDAERRARDQAIAAGKIVGARHMAERHFGNRAALIEQGGEQVAMLRRIDPVVAAGQHGDRAASDRRAMRGLIDAARQPGDDDEAGIAEIARQLAGEFQSGAGGVARADDRDHRPRQHVRRPAHAEQRRRILERRQPRRIGGFARRDQRDADLFAAAISARACSSLQIRPEREAPPRRARSGSCSSAARASPKWAMSELKVRGPTLSLRISRSRSIRSVSVMSVVSCVRSCMRLQHCPT